jgi:putative ABC transport system permease protein
MLVLTDKKIHRNNYRRFSGKPEISLAISLNHLKDIHLKGAPQYPIEPAGSLTTVYIFAVIAILILFIAIINYINLATAKSAGRAKEVGIRKVSGSR